MLYSTHILPKPAQFASANSIISLKCSGLETRRGRKRTIPQVLLHGRRPSDPSGVKKSTVSLAGSLNPPGGMASAPVQNASRVANVTSLSGSAKCVMLLGLNNDKEALFVTGGCMVYLLPAQGSGQR